MSRMIVKYPLSKTGAPQNIDMPRRARILYVAMDASGPVLFAELVVDADTKAFDVQHMRSFVVVTAGAVAPEGAGHVGSCAWRSGKVLEDYHVFETRPVRAYS